MGWVRKPLVWGGVCASCASRVTQMHEGWHEPGARRVRCLACGPGTEEAIAPGSVDPSWWRGAPPGEGPTDAALGELLAEGACVLADRGASEGDEGAVRLVVAPSGVWVVDARDWEGRVEYRSDPTTGAPGRLLVGGVDRAGALDEVRRRLETVTPLVGPGTPVEAALVVERGDWNLSSLPRLVFSRPIRHGPVWIAPPRILVKRINEPGPLSRGDVARLADLLDERLASR